VQKQKSTLLI